MRVSSPPTRQATGPGPSLWMGLVACATWLGFAGCSGGGSSIGSGTVPPPPDPPPVAEASFPVFEDVSASAGVAMPHHGAPIYLSTGQAWGDYDRDGWIDLYVTDQDGENVLYRNQGDGTFQPSPVSAQVALPSATSGGALFADYDNDGWLDLLVLNFGPNVLFRNLDGQGFADVSLTAGIGDAGMGMSGAFGDYNGDGWLDLYVTNWFCPGCPDPLVAMSDRLYRNNGNGSFTDVSSYLGGQPTIGYGFIGSFLDYDNDGDADIYLVNDKGGPGTTPPNAPIGRNVLWRNDGPALLGWTFTEVAIPAGADARIDGMGIAVGDYDNDGHFDMAMSDSRPPTLLRNLGDGTFESVATTAGLTQDCFTFGLFFADFNHDCFCDLYIGAAFGPSHMYQNLQDGTFRDVAAATGTDDTNYTIGAAYADYDRDGWLDFVIGNKDSSYRLYRNQGLPGPANWFRVRLEGAGMVNRDAVGARAYLTTTNGITQMQEVVCGSSIGSGHDLALHFGLGDSGIEVLRIRWPDGLEESFTNLTPNQEWFHRHP